ncbi:P-selectin-like [Ciona intestinalis]
MLTIHHTVTNPCYNNGPCQHGGTCVRNGQAATCNCLINYEGDQCERLKSCLPPNLGPNIRVREGSSFGVGSSITFICTQSGFVVTGNQQMYCLNDQTWDRPPPVCELAVGSCPALQVPQNGRLTDRRGERNQVGNFIRLSCADGYRVVSPSITRCLSDLTWSASLGGCAAIGCSIFSAPDGVSVPVGIEHAVGAVLRLTCYNGGQLQGGPSNVECLGNHIWSNPISSYTCS